MTSRLARFRELLDEASIREIVRGNLIHDADATNELRSIADDILAVIELADTVVAEWMFPEGVKKFSIMELREALNRLTEGES